MNRKAELFSLPIFDSQGLTRIFCDGELLLLPPAEFLHEFLGHNDGKTVWRYFCKFSNV